MQSKKLFLLTVLLVVLSFNGFSQVFGHSGSVFLSNMPIGTDVFSGGFDIDSHGNSYGAIRTNNIDYNGYYSDSTVESEAGSVKYFKHDNQGNLIWQKGGGNNSTISQIVVDELNNVYISGYHDYGLFDETNCPDYKNFTGYIAKMNPNGTFQWMYRTPGISKITPTNSGNIGFTAIVEPVNGGLAFLGDSLFDHFSRRLIYGELNHSGELDWYNLSSGSMPLVLSSVDGCAYNNNYFYLYGYFHGTFDFGNYPFTLNNICSAYVYPKNQYIAVIDWNNRQVINVQQTEDMAVKKITFDENNNLFFGMQRHTDFGTCSDTAKFLGVSFPKFTRDCYLFKTDPQINLLGYYDFGGTADENTAPLDLTDIEFVNDNLYIALQNDQSWKTLYLGNDPESVTSSYKMHIMSLSGNLDYRFHNSFEKTVASVAPFMFGKTGNSLSVLAHSAIPSEETYPYHNWFINSFVTNANVINGTIYRDFNGNGIYDDGDLPLTGLPIQIDPIPYLVVTDTAGFYEAYVAQGTYTLSIPSIPLYYSSDPVPSQAVFSDYNQTQTVDVRIIPDPGISDIEVSFFSNQQLLIGESCTHKVIVKNVGTTTENVSLTLTPLNFGYNPSDITLNPPMNSTGNNYTYEIPEMNPGEVKYFDITYNTPVSFLNMIGNESQTSVIATINNTDVTIWNNSKTFSQTLRAAYDPNIKTVQEDSLLDYNELPAIRDFHYTIYFQNEGNHFATNVHITDEVESKLDIRSLEIIHSSHPVRGKILDNVIHFYFDNILLPSKDENEIESRGYVYFKLQRKDGIQLYDSIINQASIYFDYNPAIITNKTSNVFVDYLNLIELKKELVYIYPNPAKDKINIVSYSDNPLEVDLINIAGQILSSFQVTSSMTIDIESIPNGVYVIQIKDPNGSNMVKLVKY